MDRHCQVFAVVLNTLNLPLNLFDQADSYGVRITLSRAIYSYKVYVLETLFVELVLVVLLWRGK